MRQFVVSFLLLAAAVVAAEAPPSFNAVLTMNGQHRFVLTSPAGATSKWLELGQSFEGYALKDFDAEASVLELEKEGIVQKVKLVNAVIGESAAAPSTPATLEDAEAMMQAMRFDEMMAKMAAQQKEAMKPVFQQQAAQMRIPPEHRERFAEMQAQILDETMGVMASAEMREAITQLYSEVFTKEELNAMSAFHSTPAGRALIDKQPAVQQRMMQIMMRKMGEIGPRMQKMAKDFQTSIGRPSGPPPAPAPTPAPAPAN